MHYKKCSQCNGKGSYVNVFLSHKCEACNGKGFVEDFSKSEESQMSYLQAELDEITDELALIQDMMLKLEKEVEQKETYCQDLEKELDKADEAIEDLVEENRELRKKINQNKSANTPPPSQKNTPQQQWSKCAP